ncbi:MAG TPA: MBL fold metallo-hydrolase [Candidatus Acidoferrales bacterium]|nr:MBL fold metallo-hydrolase [Candidatus Acidoferrales bacterium]
MNRRLWLSSLGVMLLGAGLLGARAPSSGTAAPRADDAERPRVHALKITILSTMLADDGIGEWGFAALVEVDGNRILYDTGARPTTVLQNARELKIDLSGVRDVILSHNHADHTGGLVTLRREFSAVNPQALSRAYVAPGIFWSRPNAQGGEGNSMIATRREYEALGGTIIENAKPVQLFPGVWLTGPVPRVYPERNWSVTGNVVTPGGPVEDNVPEDQALVFDTDRGLVMLTGCGHAGIVNILDYARHTVRPAPIYAAIGGFHLFAADDAKLDWTAGKLHDMGIQNILGAHCTGLHTVYYLKDKLGLPRQACLVGAVGATFTLEKGIAQGRLAQ